MNKTEQLIIIGCGPAALTAGIYSARAELNPIIIEGKQPGGQLMGTTYIENWPGEKKILGVELMMKMKEQAKLFGCKFISDTVVNTQLKDRPFILETENNLSLKTQSLIIATGSSPKKLGCKGEGTYWGKGVTTCAVCDGTLYKNRPVIIVGGGDTAMEDAYFMTKFTKNITVVHILDKLTASKPMQNRVLNCPDIKIIYNSTIKEINGDNNHVTSAIVENQKTKELTELKVDGLFVAIGLSPQTGFLAGQLELDGYGYIKVNDGTKTSVNGVFAAGDVVDYKYRQAITAAGSGCMAALDTERFLSSIT